MIPAAVHLLLVSDQIMPNLLPLLDEAYRPEQVVLLATAEKQQQAKRLAQMLTAIGCRSDIQQTSAYQLEAIHATLEGVIAANRGKTLALNVTGGTKVMALAAFAQFYSLDWPVYYVDTTHQQLIQLAPHQQSRDLPDRLTVKTALNACGYQIETRERPALQADNMTLYRALVSDLPRWEKPLAELNYLAGKAKNAPYAEINPAWRADADLQSILAHFARAGHLSYDSAGRVIFASEDSRRLVQGGWLEHWVFAQVEQLKRKGAVRDAAMSVRVVNPQGTRNEIDVALTAANRLHLIECKTAQFKGPSTKADAVVYKLDNLAELLGGTFARALLISWHPLRPEDRQRCRDNSITVASGAELADLPRILGAWIKG